MSSSNNNEKVNEVKWPSVDAESNFDFGSLSSYVSDSHGLVGASSGEDVCAQRLALPLTNSCASGLRLLFGMTSLTDLSSVDTTYASTNDRPRAPRMPSEPSCASGIRFLRGEFRPSLASSVSSDFSLALSVDDFVLQSLTLNNSSRNSNALADNEGPISISRNQASAVIGARRINRSAKVSSKPSCASGIRFLAGDFTSFASTVSSGSQLSTNDLVTRSLTCIHNRATSRRRSTNDCTSRRSASMKNHYENEDWDELNIRPITRNMFLDRMNL
mmetsp:Transcript_24402/g.50668  ORF Transcript_24402/g.50668 Transcript_24402/m.50668 type:complete len:274 (+) Transcript_24402:74-895(+)